MRQQLALLLYPRLAMTVCVLLPCRRSIPGQQSPASSTSILS